jgi:uncharacterized membrane protein YgdD (TMEM256/DUF423 family)
MNHILGKKFMLVGAIFAGLAVVTGAFGAHALENLISVKQKHTWETGVQYQFYHALALIFLGFYLENKPHLKLLNWVGYLWITGIFCFSGSLYLLACRSITWFKIDFVGPITPIGGLFFIAGWMILGWQFYKK